MFFFMTSSSKSLYSWLISAGFKFWLVCLLESRGYLLRSLLSIFSRVYSRILGWRLS